MRADTPDIEQESCLVTVRTARKQRPCAGCRAPIRPGQRVQRAAFPPSAANPQWAAYEVHADPSQCDFGEG